MSLRTFLKEPLEAVDPVLTFEVFLFVVLEP